ncbi:restriction endonuclease [Ruminococcus albus SY3]|uniref:Restriction endonuclease n=1 Tax=Ruminococcus albus SY3 TaxID=1341156 RepID=A0A011VX99_RUMAL|nr:restriction endonuclease [Ruminococcus albus]EXM39896.1 restriction endonuclease [Ruminococcus albus SY3]
MRIVDAVMVVLKENGSLTSKEAYEKIIDKIIYEFGALNPVNVVNSIIRCHCEGLNFPSSSPVKYFRIVGKKGKHDLYSLLESDESVNVLCTEKTSSSEDDLLPEERINMSYLSYKKTLKTQLIDHILECHPIFFERLVVELLIEMGYGSDGKALGKSHDGGIDGVIYEDKLGLSKIYIQAKRNDLSNSIGRPLLQSFVGAMEDVQKGVFITTSTFTKEAQKYADKQQQKSLKLIDGDLLAELMINYGIGLEKIKSYVIYKIDEDYFE